MSISLVWKEPGLGSQHKLAQVKRDLSTGPDTGKRDRKGIGHCGTLDPFAEGILCVGVGEGTKLLSALVGLSKTYVAEMILGATTVTLDPEAPLEFSENVDLAGLTDERLTAFLKSKIGRFEQIPPQYSAIRIAGKRAFDFARKGETVELKSRSSEILAAKHLELSDIEVEGRPLKLWRLEVSVSSGTYIRALARDWSQELLGVPGTLKTLVRSQLGPWRMPSGQTRTELEISDFSALIPTVSTTPERAQALRANGLWSPGYVDSESRVAAARGYLVVDPAFPDAPVALLTPEMSVQRVFSANPFATR